MQDQLAGLENAGHENAGPICRGGNAEKICMESQSVKKCLKDRLTEADLTSLTSWSSSSSVSEASVAAA